METQIVAALIGVGAMVLINIIIAAYGYGRLNQKVSDFCRRLEKVENRVGKVEEKVNVVERIEGKLEMVEEKLGTIERRTIYANKGEKR